MSTRHLYIHIPFCPAKCPYCAFVTHIGSTRYADSYVQALEAEIRTLTVRDRIHNLDTVYLGGGTPSMLAPDRIARLLTAVSDAVGIASGAEITLEAQPSTVTPESLAGYADAGVTRLSFGIETTATAALQALHRGYGREDIARVVEAARAAGFTSLNGDLIFGLPGSTLGSWQEDVDYVLSLPLDHLSLYPLSVETATPFARAYRDGRLSLPTDDLIVAMYSHACAALASAGFVHYEVANWAREGRECHHNLAYWHNRPYAAVGVGAHAYHPPYRTENMTGVKRYLGVMAQGGDPVKHREVLSPDEIVSDSAILQLRLLQEGLDLDVLGHRYGVNARDLFGPAAEGLSSAGLLRRSGDIYLLPEEHALLGNEVWEAFLLVD